MFGFLAINKPTGWTSHDIVAKLRGIFHTQHIGHSGTLDPLATGLLVCGINNATKLFDYLKNDKEYEATFELGKISDTYDSTGVISIHDQSIQPNLEDIKKILPQFTGKILQKPPIHSAIKLQGKKAYELAREGKQFELEARPREIFLLETTDYQYPILKLKIACSSGTYIRSLGHDIGMILKTGAVMTALTRTRAGEVKLDQAYEIDKVTQETPLTIDLNWFQIPSIELDKKQFHLISNGQYIPLPLAENETEALGVFETQVSVILEQKQDLWKCKKLLTKY